MTRANRYADDIRRIVGNEEDQKGLGTAPDKPSIGATRGIAYTTYKGGIGSASSTPGAQTPAEDIQEIDPRTGELRGQQELDENDDGNTNTDPDTGTPLGDKVREPEDGRRTAENEIDGGAGSTTAGTTGPLVYDGALSYSNADTLDALYGMTDCASGESLEIRFDGVNTPVAATTGDSGTELLPEWLETDSDGEYVPPEIFAFQLGYYWKVTGSGNPTPEQGSTPYESAQNAKTYLDANVPGGRVGPFSIIDLEASPGDPTTQYTITYQDDGVPGPSGQFTLTTSRVGCAATPPDDSTANGDTDGATYAIGSTSITMASGGTGSLEPGDQILFNGDPNYYTVLVGGDLTTGATITLESPGLLTELSGTTKTNRESTTCLATNPVADAINQATSIMMRYVNGTYYTSAYSPNVPTKLAHQPKSKVDFCFGSGRFGSTEPTKDGGFMLYETSTGGGAPSGVVRVYNSSRQLVGFADSTTYNSFKP